MLDISCFGNNYIGIRFACDNSSSSGLYIDDLPGISLQLAANLADGETVRGETLIRQLEAQAIREVWQDIKHKLCEVQFNRAIETRTVGLHRQDITINYLPTQPEEVGLEVEKTGFDPYTSIRINYVDIRARNAVSGKSLQISDGCTAQSYLFDTVSDCVVRVYTNFTAFGGPVRITVDASDIELEDMPLRGGCACQTNCDCNLYGCFSVNGWNGTQEASQAYGMAVNVTCTCDETAILCSLQNDICMAVQLKLGILLLQEQLNTKRCNFFVLNSQEAAQRQLMMWLGGVDMQNGAEFKSQYWRLIAQTAQGIQQSLKTSSSACISCAGLTAIETLP